MKTWTLQEMPAQAGRRYFITGANSGIGYYAALELARRGAVVVMACRDEARGLAALESLRREATGPESAASEAELVQLDLASLASVRRAASEEDARNSALHGLINNAGVMAPKKRGVTEDGFEVQFGTNVLGHFALTCGLIGALERGRSAQVADAPRIVTIASIAHKRGRIHFDYLQSERKYVPMEAYAQSKLADLMFAFELERRLRAASLGAVSIAAHPGVAATNLFQVGEFSAFERSIRKGMAPVIGKLLNTEAEGALPTLFAATADEAKGGHYYGPKGWKEMRGGDVGEAEVAPAARDQVAASRLWEACERMTGASLQLAGARSLEDADG